MADLVDQQQIGAGIVAQPAAQRRITFQVARSPSNCPALVNSTVRPWISASWPRLHASIGLPTPLGPTSTTLVASSFEWPREDAGAQALTREQFDWLVSGLPWQRLSAPRQHAITVV